MYVDEKPIEIGTVLVHNNLITLNGYGYKNDICTCKKKQIERGTSTQIERGTQIETVTVLVLWQIFFFCESVPVLVRSETKQSSIVNGNKKHSPIGNTVAQNKTKIRTGTVTAEIIILKENNNCTQNQ